MPRSVRDARLETRNARLKLERQKEPHWKQVSPGCHLGYYKGELGGTWIARWRPLGHAGGYRKNRLGAADDFRDANAADVLSFAQAQERARRWFDAVTREAAGLEVGEHPETVGEILAAYLAWYRRERGKATGRLASVVERRILPELGDLPLERLTARRIGAWRDALAEAPPLGRGGNPQRRGEDLDPEEARRARRATANRALTVLKAALQRAHDEHGIGDPAQWKRAKPFVGADAARVRWLSAVEARRLLAACPPDFRRLARAALESGARYGELVNLKVADFVPEGPSLHIRTSKSGKPRHVPLDNAGARFFAALCAGRAGRELLLVRDDGRPWAASDQQRPMLAACAAAGIVPAASFHTLRHSYASLRVMRGAPLLVIAQALGHRDTRMVERHYGHLCPGFVRQTIEATGMGLDDEPPARRLSRSSG